ncbi:hypothetical protein CAPTEDRAFT_193291 [Capitella teleta]|uniref:Uncharacterized protein n=1 Tax=Capitella teleta TaxID=283909 RepID=R7UU05_CAPTE|nr:hypothetical protein CAPTEDRAFT_193291 [Capitella teleta]|eukprot:ELU09999.1 hypothetical protein CAPTEDRAFT_193291 [Capitella teleta]
MAAGGSRSSVSSENSDGGGGHVSPSRRWTTLDTVGRCMFFLSVAFFIIGVLLTVFGFSSILPANRLPLQIIGPACLTVTLVMWGLGCVFSRLMSKELRQQQQAIELRDRVQLYALANDILNRPVLSPAMLQDPRIRRQLMSKLRQQKTLDMRVFDHWISHLIDGAIQIQAQKRNKLLQIWQKEITNNIGKYVSHSMAGGIYRPQIADGNDVVAFVGPLIEFIGVGEGTPQGCSEEHTTSKQLAA